MRLSKTEIKDEVVRLYTTTNKNAKEIALMVGYTEQHIRNLIRQAGVVEDRPISEKKYLLYQQIEKMIDEGISPKKICETLNMELPTVRCIIKRNTRFTIDEEFRKTYCKLGEKETDNRNKHHRTFDRNQAIKEAREKGENLSDIAKEHGITKQRVFQILKQAY